MGTLLNYLTIEKRETIKNAGYNHVSTYECQLNKNKEFQKFAKNFTQEIVEPLNPKDAFYGGRANATKLLYNFKDNECGRYVDFCSLYPTVQYYKKYPIGHPTKIFNPEKHDKSWYGLIKCKIQGPRQLYHPILPQRIKVDNYDKLIFTLCKTCAETRNQNKCEHSDNERSFIGTWTMDEVNGAIEKGYKVIRTYEVWHFDKSTDDLFKGYIRRFMKIKLESSKYDFKTKGGDNSKNTNVYIACFTTSHARLMLYNKLDYLKDKVLYFDTDSIIYADDGTKNIETGDMLGDMTCMTDEISGKGISSFVSTGPKSYSFKSAIKDFTLNHDNNSLLNHDSLSKIVKKQIREITIVNENKITRKNREIVNKYCEKVFKIGYDKRVIKQVNEDHIDTLPYGY